MGKCTVNLDWFRKEDGQGRKICEWGIKHSDTEVFCKVCNKTINIVSKGVQAIIQHASTTRHLTECRLKLSPLQLHLAASSTCTSKDTESTVPVTQDTGLRLTCVKDSATTAELLWVMKVIASNYSMSSCDGISSVFELMFPGAVPPAFSLSRSKVHYLITDALGPYLKKQAMKDMEGSLYTLSYDETTNSSSKKELQITVRYWSDVHQQIISQHLETFLIGKATGEDLFEKLMKALAGGGLSIQNLLMIGSDGPNVNKKVARLVNDEVMTIRKTSLIDIGSCNIHIIHNAFLKGLHELGEDASDLIFAIHNYFDGWPARWEDFNMIQNQLNLPNHHFMKHCASRWLSVENAGSRLLEQWDAVTSYFLKYIPQKKTNLTQSSTFKRIVKMLQSPTMKAELYFLCSSAKMFTRFTGTFQKDEPLIHVLHRELNTLVQTLVGRVCKPEAINTKRDLSADVFDEHNLLPLKSVVCGDCVTEELNKASEKDKLCFLKLVVKHYVAACKHILSKAPVSSSHFVKHFRCLQPDQRTTNRSCHDIVTIAKALPLDIRADELMDEWKLLQLEKDETGSREGRIDLYWRQFCIMIHASGNLKYPKVAKVVKASLALSHGNADIERRFSISSKVVTDDRASMSERTLNAIMTVKDVLKQYKNKPEYVPITKELLSMARTAYLHYNNYLEEQKRLKELGTAEKEEREKLKVAQEETQRKLEEARQTIQQREGELKIKRKQEERKRKAGDKLFEEANERLKKALRKGSLQEVEISQAMLEGVINVRKEENLHKQAVDSLQKSLEKKKSTLITSFFSKK